MILELSLDELSISRDLRVLESLDIAVAHLGTFSKSGQVLTGAGVKIISTPKSAPYAVSEDGVYQCDSISSGSFVLIGGYPMLSDSGEMAKDLRIETGEVREIDYTTGEFKISSKVVGGMSGGPVFGSKPNPGTATNAKVVGLVRGYAEMSFDSIGGRTEFLFSFAVCIDSILSLIDEGWK
ncbi:MAG: hypothetical protein AAB305_05375 [Candidatus Zixiibacteriota bacterium]